MANILAFAESRNGELRKVALEAVTAARKLADAAQIPRFDSVLLISVKQAAAADSTASVSGAYSSTARFSSGVVQRANVVVIQITH